jgi:hypothetical protein
LRFGFERRLFGLLALGLFGLDAVVLVPMLVSLFRRNHSAQQQQRRTKIMADQGKFAQASGSGSSGK